MRILREFWINVLASLAFSALVAIVAKIPLGMTVIDAGGLGVLAFALALTLVIVLRRRGQGEITASREAGSGTSKSIHADDVSGGTIIQADRVEHLQITTAQDPTAAYSATPEAEVAPRIGDTVSIVRTIELKPRRGNGIGYDILISNRSSHEVLVERVHLYGTTEVWCAGFMPAMHRISFEIELRLDALVESETRAIRAIEADLFDPEEQEWAYTGKGFFEYEIDTGHKSHIKWSYDLDLPILARILPVDTSVLRLMLRTQSRKVIGEVSRGSTPAFTSGGIVEDSHKLAVHFQDIGHIELDISRALLEMIADEP